MNENLLDAVNSLTDQIILLREDLRPELKKSAVIRRKRAESEHIKKDMQKFWETQK
jgi:hypothetical protein